MNKQNNYGNEKALLNEVSVKLMLEDIRFKFSEKLSRYVKKNKLSQTFNEGMYNIIGDIINSAIAGNKRASVMELMKTNFKSEDKHLFYKVQYCVELFECEILNYFRKEKVLID
jgi:hypothetical protein